MSLGIQNDSARSTGLSSVHAPSQALLHVLYQLLQISHDYMPQVFVATKLSLSSQADSVCFLTQTTTH